MTEKLSDQGLKVKIMKSGLETKLRPLQSIAGQHGWLGVAVLQVLQYGLRFTDQLTFHLQGWYGPHGRNFAVAL
jgi:hypothetical protein